MAALGANESRNWILEMVSAGFTPQNGAGVGFQLNGVAMNAPDPFSFADNRTYLVQFYASSTWNIFAEIKGAS